MANSTFVLLPFVREHHRLQVERWLGVVNTDDLDYHRQMTEVFGADARFRAAVTPAELRTVVTDFERDFNARGVETRCAAYEKTAGVTA